MRLINDCVINNYLFSTHTYIHTHVRFVIKLLIIIIFVFISAGHINYNINNVFNN